MHDTSSLTPPPSAVNEAGGCLGLLSIDLEVLAFAFCCALFYATWKILGCSEGVLVRGGVVPKPEEVKGAVRLLGATVQLESGWRNSLPERMSSSGPP